MLPITGGGGGGVASDDHPVVVFGIRYLTLIMTMCCLDATLTSRSHLRFRLCGSIEVSRLSVREEK